MEYMESDKYYYKYQKYKKKYYSLLQQHMSGGGIGQDIAKILNIENIFYLFKRYGKKWKIIITLPHSKCIESKNIRKEQMCDILSEKFGYILYDKLKGDMFNINEPIKAEKNRLVLDNNRFITNKQNILHNSPMWNNLRKEIQKYCEKNSYKDIIIFDIHSFPDKKPPKPPMDYDIILLDDNPRQNIVIKLYDYLQKYYKNVNIMESRYGFNAIKDVMRTHPLYIKTVLLEINEKLNEDQLNDIANKIKDFLKEYDE